MQPSMFTMNPPRSCHFCHVTFFTITLRQDSHHDTMLHQDTPKFTYNLMGRWQLKTESCHRLTALKSLLKFHHL